MAIQTFDHDRRSYYDRVRGAVDGIFYAPYLPVNRMRFQNEASVAFSTYDVPDMPELDVADFLPDQQADLPDRDLVAIIDAGVALNHPLVRPRVVAARDFTGTGPDDPTGHGTMRTLKALLHQPTARFIIAKAVGGPASSRQTVIEALRWSAEQGAGLFYLALGEYNLFCRGGCSLCRAAHDVLIGRRVVIAAPGNRAWRTACPAKAKGVTRTTTSSLLDLMGAFYRLRHRADLSTVPSYLNYPGEPKRKPGQTPLGGLFREYGGKNLRIAREAGADAYAEHVDMAARGIHAALAGPLPANLAPPDPTWGPLRSGFLSQLNVLDEVWENVSEGLLDAFERHQTRLQPLALESMWVPMGGPPKTFRATIPAECPEAGRHLIVDWEYAWGNLSRTFWGPQRETFYEKATGQLNTYLSAHPADADAHFQLGVIDLASGFLVKAYGSLMQAQKLHAQWPALSYALQQVSQQYRP